MTIRKLIRETIENQAVESQVDVQIINKDYLIQRIPFLKEFKLVADKPGQESSYLKLCYFNKEQYNSNVALSSPDLNNKVELSHLNFFSDVNYSAFERNNQIIHNFSIKNDIILIAKKDPNKDSTIDSITNHMISMMLKKQLETEMSAHFELKEQNGHLSKYELDNVINEINGKLFKFGEFIQTHYKKDFLAV